MTRVETEKFAELLRDCGYKARITENGYIQTGSSGVKVGAFLYSGKTVQLTCSFTLDEDSSFSLEHANEFNAEYRFAKMYAVGRSVLMSWDFLLDIDRPTAKDDLVEAMDIYDSCIGFMRRTLEATLPSEDSEDEASTPTPSS